MKIELEDVGAVEKKLSITVPVKAVERELTRIYRKLRKEVALPGFRQGKVPRKLLEQQYRTRISAEVSAKVVDQAVEKAVAEHQLAVVGKPEFEPAKVVTGKPLRLTAKVQVRPRPDIGDYTGIEVDRVPPTMTDQELEQHLTAMRQQTGVLDEVAADEAAADGDIVDVTLTLSDPSYGDLVREHQRVSLPDDPMHPFLPDIVRGLKQGQGNSAEVTMPADYNVPDWSERKCRAAVVVHEIKRVRMAPLDDAFAKQMGHETVDGLREELRERLLDMKSQRGHDREGRQLIAAIIERNPFEIPEAMVADRAQLLVDAIAARVMGAVNQQAKPTVDDLEDDKRDELLKEAEFSVRRELILEAIGRQEGLRVSDDERDAHIERMAKQAGHQADTMRALLIGKDAMSEVDNQLLERKAIDWLLERAEVVESL